MPKWYFLWQCQLQWMAICTVRLTSTPIIPCVLYYGHLNVHIYMHEYTYIHIYILYTYTYMLTHIDYVILLTRMCQVYLPDWSHPRYILLLQLAYAQASWALINMQPIRSNGHKGYCVRLHADGFVVNCRARAHSLSRPAIVLLLTDWPRLFAELLWSAN